MIIEQVGIIATHASALFGVRHAPYAGTVDGLAGFTKCSGEDVPHDGEYGWSRHYYLNVVIVVVSRVVGRTEQPICRADAR